MKRRLSNLIGKKFNSWTVLDRAANKNNITMWHCICDCQKTSEVSTTNLTSGKSKSCRKCGTKKRGKEQREPIIDFAFKYFITYNARNRRNGRGVTVSLNSNQWFEIAKNNCFYCDSEPLEFSPYKSKDESIFVNGLDRIDSSIGYTIENCVPCCLSCNIAKSDLTKNEFFNKIKLIYEKHLKNKK